MLESLLICARCVFPVLMLIALGALCRRLHWLDGECVSQMDRVTFRVLLPVLLFQNIYTCGLDTAFDARLMITAAVMSLLSFGLSILFSGLIAHDPPRRASLAQGIFRNNCVVYGLPIITALYGPSATAAFSMLLACVIPLNNILAVVLLSSLANRRLQPFRLIRDILLNPFVISAALGLALNLCGVVLPSPVAKVVSDLSAAATPIALLLLGAGLRIEAATSNRREILWGVGLKLIGLPLLFVPVLAALGFRGVALVSLYLAIGTPCAVSAHVMARQMGADGELAGQLVVFGAIGSIVSIFLILLALRLAALI